MIRLGSENSEQATADLRLELEKLFSKFSPSDIPSYHRESVINLCLHKGVWPQADSKPMVLIDAAKTKTELMQAIDAIPEVAPKVHLKINALLQALCKQSFLGNIIHTQRRMWGVPAIDREGSTLQLIAKKLEDAIIALGADKIEVTEDTQKALKAESDRNVYLDQSLIKYPNLQHVVSSCCGKMVEQKPNVSTTAPKM